MQNNRKYPRLAPRTGIVTRLIGHVDSATHEGKPVNVSQSGAYLYEPALQPGSYEIEFHDAAGSARAAPRVSRHCEVLPGRSDGGGFGVALKFGIPLAEAELGEVAAPHVSHESIDLAKSDRQVVNAELAVIRACRGQIFLATLSAIGAWLIGAIGLGLTNHLQEPTWLVLGASFPYLILSISILCLLEKANAISNRKAFLAAIDDDLRMDRCPPNYLGWAHLSINHDACKARAAQGLCVRDKSERNCRCYEDILASNSEDLAPVLLRGTLDRFGTLATMVIAPMYIGSSALLYWYCCKYLFQGHGELELALAAAILTIAVFLIINVWSTARGRSSVANRYLRWRRALRHCRTIDGIPALGFKSQPN